jgi:hypothetical protein
MIPLIVIGAVLRLEDFNAGGIGGVELGLRDVPRCADKLEHVGSGDASGPGPTAGTRRIAIVGMT